MRTHFLIPILASMTLAGCADVVDSVPEWNDPGVRAYESRDFQTAFEIWFPQADAGIAEPQWRIATMFACERHVKRDLIEALKWSSLSLKAQNELAPQVQRLIAREMTEEEIAEAVRRAEEWRPRYKRPGGRKSTETIMERIPVAPDGGNVSESCFPEGWREKQDRA